MNQYEDVDEYVPKKREREREREKLFMYLASGGVCVRG